MASARYPTLPFDLRRDCFVVWLRWVAMEDPPSPDDPPGQGIRIELQLNRNPVVGPTIVYRRDLDAPVYLREQLAPGIRVDGPALITEDQTTTVVSSSYVAEIDARGYIVLTHKEQASD